MAYVLAMTGLMSFKVPFIPWLIAIAVVHAITGYAATRKRAIIGWFLIAAISGCCSWVMLPVFIGAGGADYAPPTAPLVLRIAKWIPLLMFFFSIVMSSLLGMVPLLRELKQNERARRAAKRAL